MASTIKIYYILPHGTVSSAVNIVNLDPYLDAFHPVTREDLAADPHGTVPESLGALQKEAKTVVKDKAPAPWLTCTKKGFLSSNYVVSAHEAAGLAEMKISAWWGASNIKLSGSTSPASPGHPITIQDKHWYSREMTFVIDSMMYKWGMDSSWHSRRFTLYKNVQHAEASSSSSRAKKGEGQGGEVCAKCLIGWTSWTSATVVVDTEKIDPLIAVLTVLPVLFRIKATRQAYEWGGYSGGE